MQVGTVYECEIDVKEEIQSDSESVDDSDELEEEHSSGAAVAKNSNINIRKRKIQEKMDELSESKHTIKTHTRRRVTYNQLEALWEILDKNRDLGTGFNKTAQAREYSKRMWKLAAATLNSQGEGAKKDWKGWCKYWNDYKSKLKGKAASARASLQESEGGTSNEVKLTDLELKYLQLLGDDFGASLPRVKVEPFDIPIEDWIKAESGPQRTGQNGESDSIMAHHLIIEPLILPEPTPPSPPPPPPPPAPVPATSVPSVPSVLSVPSPRAASPHSTLRRRRRMKPISADAARRALVNTSEERLRIEERRNQILENLTHEIRELKHILITRLPAPP